MSETEGKTKIQSGLLIKIAILGFFDLICFVVLLWLLNQLPVKAENLKKLNNLKIKNLSSNTSTIESEIMVNKTKSEKLQVLFPDETGLVNFIKEMERLKSEAVIADFSFVSNKVLKDKTGLYGLPFTFELRGKKETLGQALAKIDKLPFMTRAVDIEIKKLDEEEGFIFKFGGLLYVDESFYKD